VVADLRRHRIPLNPAGSPRRAPVRRWRRRSSAGSTRR
jgi:hypothetical protein